jgi:formate-dependent nitrite reductase membrane component NrfD
MTQTSARLVGDTFKLGYRRQSYWGRSIAMAFFCAEVGAGTFLVSLYYDCLIGMILGLVLAGVLKPYFQVAHMGVPLKSWRAILRFDRSWVSRGTIAIVCFIIFGVLHVIDRRIGLFAALGLPPQIGSAVKILAIASGVVLTLYQGMAMSASESFTLWASPLMPVASLCYSLTAGVLTVLTIVSLTGTLDTEQQAGLLRLLEMLFVLNCVIVIGILLHVKNKSKGGAFSVNLLLKGELAGRFRGLVFVVGFVLPFVLLLIGGTQWLFVTLSWIAMLIGFYTFRVAMFRAAVYEPITHDFAGSIGLPRAR